MPTENRSSNTEAPFRREDRYLVIKYSDLDRLQGLDRHMFLTASRRAHEQMFAAGAHARQFLVIESDWPEFEPTWAAIEARMTGKPAEQHQGEPVAWVYMRNGKVNYDTDIVISNAAGDTLGDGDSWDPVYARADDGEVERLHQGHIKSLEALNQQTEKQRDHWMAECEELRTQLRLITGDYRTAIVNGHERITFLGGDCDSVEKMLADNPNYAKARALLERKP